VQDDRGKGVYICMLQYRHVMYIRGMQYKHATYLLEYWFLSTRRVLYLGIGFLTSQLVLSYTS
jgi:hypothetical protein